MNRRFRFYRAVLAFVIGYWLMYGAIYLAFVVWEGR